MDKGSGDFRCLFDSAFDQLEMALGFSEVALGLNEVWVSPFDIS